MALAMLGVVLTIASANAADKPNIVVIWSDDDPRPALATDYHVLLN